MAKATFETFDPALPIAAYPVPEDGAGVVPSIVPASPLLRLVVIGAGLVIIAAGFQAAASVVNLVLLSLLLAATLSPIPFLLTKRGVGQGAAIAITILLSLLGGAALMFVLARSLSRLSDNLPTYQNALAGLLGNLENRLAPPGGPLGPGPKPGPREKNGRGRVL